MSSYKYLPKSIMDYILGIIGFIILLPMFCVVILILVIQNNGKVFFTQERPGKNGKIFKVFKFRTMTDKRDDNGKLLSDSLRITPAGRIIRRLSLDEIPQLLNVLKGDMSIVGPRPLLVEYLKLFNEKQFRRMEVKPGITGWAQVNGRNLLEWESRFEMDIWYVDNISFVLDVKILIMTFVRVVMMEGVNSGVSITMEKFEGSKDD